MTHPKAARISPDSRPIAFGAAGLASAIYLGAFATSFFGQSSLAAYMLIPPQLQYVAPAVVDLALILFTLATLVRRSRGESTLITNLATGFWTAVSIAANIFHVLIPAGPQASWTAGGYAGAALSALMPIAALGASLVIENVLIARPGIEVSAPVVTEEAAPDIEPEHLAVPVPVEPKRELPVAVAAAPALIQEVPAESVTVPVLVEARPAPAPRPAPPAAAAAAPLPAPRPVQQRQSAQDSTAAWAALSRAEQADLVQALKDDGLSIPKIADQMGVSVSTIKRVRAETEVSQLQMA